MKRKFAVFALVFILITGLLSGCSSSNTIDSKEARKGVVRVFAIYNRSYYSESGKLLAENVFQVPYTGTAFGVGKTGEATDIFVTNRHVIDYVVGMDVINGVEIPYLDKFSTAYVLKDDYAYDENTGLDLSRATLCKVLYKAEEDEADLAVLQTVDTLEDRMALPLLDPDYELEVGDEVSAIGYPGSSDKVSEDTAGSVERATVTDGTISVFLPYTYSDISGDISVSIDTIQHTATINHGNSGGPLVLPTGEVAGVNTWSVGSGSSNDIPTNNSIEIKYVTKVLDDLDIEYDVRKPSSDNNVVIGAGIAALAIIAIAAVVIIAKKRPATVAGPKGGNTSVPPTSGNVQETSRPPVAPPVVPVDSGLRIQCTSGVFAGKRFAISKQMRIGRDPARNDLVFPADTQGVSGVHCVLVYQDNQLYLQDLGSTYGTFLGTGQRLAAKQAVVLHIGDKFSLGSQRECFTVTGKGGI